MQAVDRAEKDLRAKAGKEIAGAALRTAGVAKMRVTAVDHGAIRNSINAHYDPASLSASVTAGNIPGKQNYAAYVEFGTGQYAAAYVPTLDPEFQALARTFYVNGKGRMRAQPYLIPAYLQEGKRLADRLRNLKINW